MLEKNVLLEGEKCSLHEGEEAGDRKELVCQSWLCLLLQTRPRRPYEGTSKGRGSIMIVYGVQFLSHYISIQILEYFRIRQYTECSNHVFCSVCLAWPRDLVVEWF